MYIHQIEVRNYSVHKKSVLDLHPLTVLVGPQGGGKSAFFDAMLNFSMLSRGNLRQAFGPWPYSFRATTYRGARNPVRIGYRVEMSQSRGDASRLVYEIEYAQIGSADQEAKFTIPNEVLTLLPEGTVLFDRRDPDAYPIASQLELEEDRSLLAAIRHAELTGKHTSIFPLVLHCSQQISRFNRFKLEPGILAQPCRLPDPARAVTPRIGYHGEDLAATLYHLSETKDASLDVITNKMREIDSEFEKFDFNAVGTDRIAFAARYRDARDVTPSVRMSSGTLNYLGLVTLVSTPDRPSLLIIEEPENGLTPQAVNSFYSAVRSLANADKAETRSQILLSSHSPFVICDAWNGEDRDFIYQVKIDGGKSLVRKFSKAIDEQGIHLRKEKGERTSLGLAQASNVMSGYMA